MRLLPMAVLLAIQQLQIMFTSGPSFSFIDEKCLVSDCAAPRACDRCNGLETSTTRGFKIEYTPNIARVITADDFKELHQFLKERFF
ncbi:hypothetical protein NW752_006884 [Fusarium irregulare]|nr:hypothetical protein NW752_006884 [Fusarium irregulare]